MARKLTFEAGMSELEALTERLAEGDMTLDETIKTYEKGVALAAQLKQQLADCSRRIEQIDPETADIRVDGETVNFRRFTYVLLHKPAGVLSAVEDSRQRTVLDLLPQELKRQGLSPVGRLDKDTEGLLLLTNDGALTHRLLSPKSHVDKVYYARTEGTPTEADAARLAQGITLADGLRCLPAELEICGEGQVLLTLREGKFHQAKRMLAFCGTPVVYLKRLSMGPLRLGEDLRPGEFRHLTQEEIDRLQQAVGFVAADCQKNDNNFCKIHKKPLANP